MESDTIGGFHTLGHGKECALILSQNVPWIWDERYPPVHVQNMSQLPIGMSLVNKHMASFWFVSLVKKA